MILVNPVSDINLQAKIEYLESQMSSVSDGVLSQITEALEASKPEVNKAGQIAKLIHSDGMFVWELVDDPNYSSSQSGTYIDPIEYVDGMFVTEGLFYTDGNDIWEAIQTGKSESFDSKYWFDII